MKDFLSSFMFKNRNPSDDFLNSEQNRFQQTCDTLVKFLGSRSFNPHGALNSSFFDAVFVAFARNISTITNDIKSRLGELQNDVDFMDLTSKATTNVTVIQKRLKLAESILFG